MAENNPLLEIDGLGSPKEESNPLLQIDGLGETVPDVKKKEQTEPTQEAPLPGLGGVSEESTRSPIRAPKGIKRTTEVKLPQYESPSTVLMAHYGDYSPPEANGKYAAFPTLFPKDPNNQTSNPDDWILAENEDQAYEIAKKRGEVLYYDTPEEAASVAEGSWKENQPSPSVGQGVLRDVDRTQPTGEAFISRASDLTRTDVREPQQDGGADVMSEFILPPQNAEYTINDKKVSRSEFKDFMYDRNNAQDVFNGVSSISVKNDPEMEKFASRQVQSRETNDVWDSLKSGVITLGSSVLGAQQMVGDFLEDLTGIQPTGFAEMEKAAREESIKKLQEKAKEAQESRFQAEGDFIDLVSNGDFSEAGNMAINTVVESGPLSLTALAATAATGNPMAGFAVLAPITTGMTYSEQMTTEDEAIKNLSDTEKYLRATAFGLAEAGSEAISGKILGRSFKLFGKGVSDMVGRVASEFGEQAATDVARSSAKKTISEIMKNYGLSMAEEGAAEGLTQLTQNLTDAFLGIREMSLEQVLEGVGNAIALGAASGGIMSTPGAVGQTVSDVSKKVLDYKLSKKNGAEELTSDAKRMAEFNKIFADNLSNIESNIELRNEAVSATPNDMVSDTETVDLVEEKKRIEKEIEGKDPVLSEDLKNRINDINSELKNKVESKKKESEAVPAKQKGRLTKFSTSQDGIVGEVTYEDGTKKELTQEEYDALEKQEGLFDVETGTQPVAETVPTEAVVEEDAPTETPSEMAAEKVEEVPEQEVVKPTEAVAEEAAPVVELIGDENENALDAYSRHEEAVQEEIDGYDEGLAKEGLKKENLTEDEIDDYIVGRIQEGSYSEPNELYEKRDAPYRSIIKILTERINDSLGSLKSSDVIKKLGIDRAETTPASVLNDQLTSIGEGIKKDPRYLSKLLFNTVANLLAESRGLSYDGIMGESSGFSEGQKDDFNKEVLSILKDIESAIATPITVKDVNEYSLKQQRDAIQEQAAGKVPVQPEAKAGEKVEEGKPKAEPEVAAEKGKAEVSEEEVKKVADTTGTKPKNIRDLYNINRDMFGQDRVKSLASAIVMDRVIAVMAKRAGISKAEMYSRLQFKKAENVPDGVKFQVDAWHGSPYEFTKFELSKIGTGEGAQAFGWGLYFTDLESIAKHYAESVGSIKANTLPSVIWSNSATYFKINGIDIKNPIIQIIAENIYKAKNVRGNSYTIDNAKSSLDSLLKTGGLFGFNLGENITQKQYDGAITFLKNYTEGGSPSIELIIENIPKYLYKVSLHKGKTPDQYTFLEWDKPLTKNQIDALVEGDMINLSTQQALLDYYGERDEFEINTTKDLKDVLESEELTGKELYTILSQYVGNGTPKEASLALLDAGIDGIKYPAESIARGATSDTARGFNYVVFDENAVSIEEVLKFQKDANKARGAAMVNMDGTAVIYAMTDPNVSTPLHEIAHVFEHYLTDAERKAVMKFAGTKEWSVETSEKFARGFEKYLADGIAPTAELQKIFDKFKQWMLDIYNGITGSDIDIKLNDEMRGIYDAMLGKEPVKETAESEKVKAAKENLNSVWEKWKQSQKNLGVVFDPKSKANEDMELLEAFLTYIKALGVKTAKDIQKAFNDFTGGEATLDDAGAKFVAEKVKPKKGETNYEKTEDMNRKDLEKRGKSLFNAAKKLFMGIRREGFKFSSDTRELLKSTTDIRPVYDYFVARLGSPGNANLIFQDAKKKIYDGIFPNLRRHLDSLIKYRRIITINESRVESNRNGINSLKASEMFEKAGDEAVNAFNEAVSAANDYANSTEQQALDARGIRNEALRSLRQSEWYRLLSEVKQKRFEKQFREDLGFLKNENFTGKDSNGNPIGLSVAREMLSEIEAVVGEKDFNKINESADAYFNEFRKMLEKDLKKGIISQEQYDAMIGKDYSPRVFIQHMFGFDGEFIENIDEARLMREYSLSSDAIKTLREGLKDLNTDEAYWELITDSEKLLAGYISSRERRYSFNDLNRKMVGVLSKLESEFNELKKKEKFTKEERLRYKKLGNILDAFSTKRKRGMSSANYYENGEKKSFYIRDDIFKQWYDMVSTWKPSNYMSRSVDFIFKTLQRTLQTFATGNGSPFFFIFNTPRDFIQVSIVTDVYGNWTFTPISMAKAMKDFAKAVSHIYKEDALYREAMENGVGMDFLYMEKGLGLRKTIKESLLKLAEKSDIARAGSMALLKGFDALSSAIVANNRYSELGFRIGVYERVRDAEYKKIEAAKGDMTNEEYLEAQKDARKKAAAVSSDIMNFREGGSLTKKLNPYASYLNAAAVGADTAALEFRKNPPAFTFRVAQGTAILSTVMLGIGLMMLNMFDEDDEEEVDGKDKKYGTLKKYYKILDSINPYYRNKFYIIPTGGRDENGNYKVIRIAKNPVLIPISYAAEKALRYNLEKQLLGSEERYSSEDLKKDAFEINYLFHEYVMPINLSPVDENGKIQEPDNYVSTVIQRNIPLSLMMIMLTGYDPYTNRYISPEKKYQSELDSKYLIGWNDPEIQGFYKDMAMELNTSITPKEMKVMVEKVITRPENNPIIASVYSMLDRNNKTSDIIKKDRSLVSDILNMTKKVAVISADYGGYAKKPKTKKIEQKIREHKEEKYATSKIPKTVVYDIIKKVKNKEIDALDIDTLVSEMDKMVSTQIDVFKEANVEISERDEMEIRHKVYRNAVPALNLPELPTQYKLTYVVDRDPVVMAYRFFEDFGDVDVQGDQFKEISAQMMNEYRGQYNSMMSKDKFNKFLTKYIEAKNDPELIGD